MSRSCRNGSRAIRRGPSRDLAGELVAAIVAMYGAGPGADRRRPCPELDPAGRDQLAEQLGEDPVVSTLLLIHDLHPVALEDRVQSALDSVRPYMESHGGNVELLSVRDGVARIHLRGSCSDCSASSVTLELADQKALEEAAPDLARPRGRGDRATDARAGAADGHREHRVRAAGGDVRRAGAGMASSSTPGSSTRHRRSARGRDHRRVEASSWWPTSREPCSPTGIAAPRAVNPCTAAS